MDGCENLSAGIPSKIVEIPDGQPYCFIAREELVYNEKGEIQWRSNQP
jgi:hypothetical protein